MSVTTTMSDQVGQYSQFGICPDCRTILGWDSELCPCGRRIKKACPACSKPYWIWWPDCRGCRGKLPAEGPTKPGALPYKPLPAKFPTKPHSETGPCPKCHMGCSWENKNCQNCGHRIERPCDTCRAILWSWWHKCGDCKWPNKFI